MNQGKIWTVVHPTVGLPLLLGSVTLISLVVHASVLNNTTWMADFWQGAAKPAAVATDSGRTAVMASAQVQNPSVQSN
jgi:light-harvesting protein B-800-850 alpha chain